MGTASVQVKKKAERILIVEDDGIIAHDIQLMLEELGYEVAGVASSGAEALALAAQQAIDLLLMDVNIKGEIDGIETAAQLVERYRLPVVYLTAHTDDDTLKRARETEPFGYLAKPITMTGLKVVVAVALTRYRSQRQVEKREEWLHSILQSTSEAMLITDSAGRVVIFNQAAEEITGTQSQAACGRPIDDVLKILDENGNAQPIQTTGEAGPSELPQILSGSIVRADQTERQVVASLAALQQEPGAGSVIVLRDISEVWAREQQLTEANEKLTHLSQSLSHDLREPLRAINWYSEKLSTQDQQALSKDTRHQLERIGRASRRLGTVMSALEEYFTVAALDRAHAQRIEAAGPFREALLNLSSAIESSHAQIETSQLPLVYVHPTALMLIFQNLLANAIKYAGRDAPRVRVSADREDSFWRFTVADNGSGFDPKQAQRIFELFGRAHGREHSGSGIGLATCQRLVEQHSGRIWAETKLGEGSRFYFTLPAG